MDPSMEPVETVASRPAAGAPVVLGSSTDHLFAGWGALFMVVWRHETTLAAVAELAPLVTQFAAQHPRFALLVIVEESASLPSSTVRERIAASLQRVAPYIGASAVVHEGSGFRAAAVRAVLAGLGLIVRPPYPHQIFARVDAAGRWLAAAQRGMDAAGICDAVRALRAYRPVR
jgi:N-acetylglucosamine kinase-like BadF-type ATPase